MRYGVCDPPPPAKTNGSNALLQDPAWRIVGTLPNGARLPIVVFPIVREHEPALDTFRKLYFELEKPVVLTGELIIRWIRL